MQRANLRRKEKRKKKNQGNLFDEFESDVVHSSSISSRWNQQPVADDHNFEYYTKERRLKWWDESPRNRGLHGTAG